MNKFIIGLVIVLAVAIPCCKLVVPTFGDYSDGERSGILQKFSEKGLIFKTHEGELAMEGMKMSSSRNGGASSIFEFSVTDKNVIAALDTLSGKNVTLKYHQVYHANLSDGSTEYFITSVKLAK